MLCKDVMYEIEKEYPLNYALSWDNVRDFWWEEMIRK